MSEYVVHGVPTDEVKQFCRIQRAAGASKCEGKDMGGGKSDVTVAFPDAEHFTERTKRLNS